MNNVHLKGLDTFRALAALVVLVSHIELFKSRNGFHDGAEFYFFRYTGAHTAVILFFVISGFIITYLLLKEKEKTKEIRLKHFYLRRILRVLPLYFLIILISYLASDYTPEAITLCLSLTIFPNIAEAMGMQWGPSPQIWSIGVEEQFYLFWPLIIKRCNKLLLVFILIFLFFSLVPHLVLVVLNHSNPDLKLMGFVTKLIHNTKFNCMAIGAIFAFIYLKKAKLAEMLYKSLFLSYLLILLPFVLWFSGVHFSYFTDEFYSILFALSILLTTTNPNVINIDTKISSFLGRISYGIYMFHWIILEVIFRNKLLDNQNETVFNIILYTLTIALTITLATLSYYLFEKRFLKLKEKFSSS